MSEEKVGCGKPTVLQEEGAVVSQALEKVAAAMVEVVGGEQS